MKCGFSMKELDSEEGESYVSLACEFVGKG